MLSISSLLFSAAALTFLCLLINRTVALAFFFSIGMLLIFTAWLQFINVDGSWPADQPRVEGYKISKEKESKLDELISPTLSNSEWDDYRRCKYYNVCVRRFSSLKEPR